MADVERSALGRESERKKARHPFYPCSTPLLFYFLAVLFISWGTAGLSRLPTAPHHSLFCRASLRQDRSVVLPSNKMLSRLRLKQPAAAPTHRSQFIPGESCLLPAPDAAKKWKFVSSCLRTFFSVLETAMCTSSAVLPGKWLTSTA